MINSNNLEYEIKTDGQFAEVLRYFDKDFITSLIIDGVNNRFRAFTKSAPNAVNSLELKFKDNLINFPQNEQEIMQVRDDTYRMIINILCTSFNLQINNAIEYDPYSVALYMYDFFVSKFSANMVFFFSSYIQREKNAIYDGMNLVEFKKNKDSSSLHAKKMYNDQKIIAIMANIGYVLKNISTFDISLTSIFNSVFAQPEPATFVSNVVLDNGDFFKNYYCCYTQDTNEFNPTFITMVTLQLQNHLINTANKIDIMED